MVRRSLTKKGITKNVKLIAVIDNGKMNMKAIGLCRIDGELNLGTYTPEAEKDREEVVFQFLKAHHW